MKTIAQLEKMMIDHNEMEYYDIKEVFKFAGKKYETSLNYAYLNANLDIIFNKYKLPYDASWMWLEKLTYSNSVKEVDKIVKRLFDLGVDKLTADWILFDVVNLVNKIINLLDDGSKTSLDISLFRIMSSVLKDDRVRKVMFEQHIHEDMLPEEIANKKIEILKLLKTLDIPGVKELLLSESGVKADQVFNCIIGLWLRTRIQDMNEVAPRLVTARWLDGIKTKDEHFIETNINRQAVIVSKQNIKDSGKENKRAGILSQDLYIHGDDCGSIHGIWVEVRNAKDLANLQYKYEILPGGELRMISTEDIHLIGKKIKIRSIFTCNNNEGICPKCFGKHYVWNTHTEEYRKDLGSEYTSYIISPISQKVISVKHSVTPNVLSVVFYIENYETGELSTDYSHLFERKFNKIIPLPGVEAYFLAKSVTNNVYKSKGKNSFGEGSIEYVDWDYNEMDIIRCKYIYMVKDGVKYGVYMEAKYDIPLKIPRIVDFRLKGFPKFNIFAYGDEPISLMGDDKLIMHVIPNDNKIMSFQNVKNIYNSETKLDATTREDKSNKLYFNSIEELVSRAKEELPSTHISAIEILFRNKIKSMYNPRFRPDWSKPNADKEYVILSEIRALHALRSLSVKLGLGWFKHRVMDDFYYKPDNLVPSTYDLLFDSETEINEMNRYVDAQEDEIEDLLFMYDTGDNNVD